MGESSGSKARIERWGSLVAFSHSVFALPFALQMVALINVNTPVSPWQITLLIVCVVSARTAAMAFNRVVDADIDSLNPRTQGREVPAGLVSVTEGWFLVAGASLVFLLGSFLLGVHCLLCAPFVLVLLLSYSFFKRFSAFCHLVLGVALACAPGGVWYALTGRFSVDPLPLMGGVLLWVAGFDILYSLQDQEFDSKVGLYSVPVLLGTQRSKMLSRVLHLGSAALLILSGFVFNLGWIYWTGLIFFSASVAMQHVDVARHGIGVIGKAFFLRNGVASLILCFATFLDRY